MPLADLRNNGVGAGRGVQQANNHRCGAACAAYLLGMLGIHGTQLAQNVGALPADQQANHYRSQEAQDAAMAQTHTAGRSEAWGSTPRKIAEYVASQYGGHFYIARVPEAGMPIATKARARWRRTTHFWLATCRTQLQSYPVSLGIYGPNDAILRNFVPQRTSVTSHFVVQTFFNGGTQIMDPETGNISNVVSYQAYLNNLQNPGETTLLDLVLTA